MSNLNVKYTLQKLAQLTEDIFLECSHPGHITVFNLHLSGFRCAIYSWLGEGKKREWEK